LRTSWRRGVANERAPAAALIFDMDMARLTVSKKATAGVTTTVKVPATGILQLRCKGTGANAGTGATTCQASPGV